MANEMSDYAIGVRGHVRVWANTSAIVQFLPHDVRLFLDDNPSVKISLEERLSGEVVEAIGNGRADIGIFADNVFPPASKRRSIGKINSSCLSRTITLLQLWNKLRS